MILAGVHKIVNLEAISSKVEFDEYGILFYYIICHDIPTMIYLYGLCS